MSTRVLVVDDIPINVKLLEARLSSENFDVITATTGADALDICRHQKVDLLLLDLEMPHMTGYEVCRQLKSDISTQEIPIIVITAHEEDTKLAHAYEMGVDDFLTKPVDELALMTRVHNLLKQKKLKEEIARRQSSAHPSVLRVDKQVSLSEIGIKKEGGRILFLDESTRLIPKVLAALSDVHHIVVATSFQDATQSLKDHAFDLFLFNAVDGLEETLKISRMMHSKNATAEPSILLIVSAVENLLHLALKEDVNDYVLFPINHYDLCARVNIQLSLRRLSLYLEMIDPR